MKKLFKKLANFLTNKNNILNFFAGFSLVFAYAPFEQWWIIFFALPLWFHQLKNQSPKASAIISFAFALGWFVAGISWVHVSIAEFGGMPLPISLLLMFFLCLYLAIYPALSAYLATKLASKLAANNFHLQLWLLAPFWLLTEYMRGVFLTGFPWLSFGYSQINGPLASLAPIIGEIGISFVLFIISIALYLIFQKQQTKIAIINLLLCGLAIVISAFFSWTTPTDKTIKVALVQGNIEQALKWLPEQEWPTMQKYLALSPFGENIDLIVWPESAIPAIEPTVQDYLHNVNDIAHEDNTSLITGIINYQYKDRAFFNSLIVLGNKEDSATKANYAYDHSNRYSKNHLLPIGEFIPFGDFLRPLAPLFNLPMSSFSRGQYQQNNLIAKDINILPLICFEIAFTEQLAANFNDQTHVLLTVSNDAWFADSHGPHQHMEIARMRALEYGRPLLRSTNTGITAVVDQHGEFIGRSPQFQETVLKADVTLVTGKTPFSIYGRSLIYSIAFIFFLLMITVYREKK